ncbi:MAG: chromosomal DNA transformation protein, partial [Verrucomicrobiaceae bacterium]|nr:chromosomal DNA transformation protein [Verrucomicrobiaceae bacterium]
LVTGGSQILDELSPAPPEARTPATLHESPDNREVTLSAEESRIMTQLSGEERSMDQIIEESGLPASTVASTLLRLEMRSLARQLPGSYFVKAS